jgi:hypothetical protein
VRLDDHDGDVLLGVGSEIAGSAPLGRDCSRQQKDTDVRDTHRFLLAEVQSVATNDSLTVSQSPTVEDIE